MTTTNVGLRGGQLDATEHVGLQRPGDDGYVNADAYNEKLAAGLKPTPQPDHAPGPYVVTTKRQDPEGGVAAPDGSGWTPWPTVSRVAVAALDRAALIDAGVPPFTEVLDAVQAGERVAQSRNGTVIDVATVTKIEREQAALKMGLSPRATDREWCDAFNAQEAKR